jgi:hypothetical protein
MFLKFGTVQVFTPHPMIPTMESNAMVINYSGGVDCPLEVFIPL